jgi:hypothetical protein
MEDTLKTRIDPVKVTGKRLLVSRDGVMTEQYEDGQQRLTSLPWHGNLAKTVLVGGEPFTLAQIRSANVALFEAVASGELKPDVAPASQP